MKRLYKPLSLVLLTLMLLGCNTTSTYHWGNYEELLYSMYVKPGEAPPALQIQKLSNDIEQANNLDKPVPPGVYAHLGYMYAIEGNASASNQAFESELAMYPESKVLIEGMLKRVKDNNTKGVKK